MIKFLFMETVVAKTDVPKSFDCSEAFANAVLNLAPIIIIKDLI